MLNKDHLGSLSAGLGTIPTLTPVFWNFRLHQHLIGKKSQCNNKNYETKKQRHAIVWHLCLKSQGGHYRCLCANSTENARIWIQSGTEQCGQHWHSPYCAHTRLVWACLLVWNQ